MQPRLSLLALVLLAGCAAPEEAASFQDEASPPAMGAAAASEAAASASVQMPISLEGNTGTAAGGCVAAAGECTFVATTPGTTGILLEGLGGRIEGGSIVISWSPSSPATSELSAGFMLMGAEACDSIELASARGAAPLTLTIAKMPRELCAGEIVHLWVAGTNWGEAGGAYYQVDVDQAFVAEGAFLLAPGTGA